MPCIIMGLSSFTQCARLLTFPQNDGFLTLACGWRTGLIILVMLTEEQSTAERELGRGPDSMLDDLLHLEGLSIRRPDDGVNTKVV